MHAKYCHYFLPIPMVPIPWPRTRRTMVHGPWSTDHGPQTMDHGSWSTDHGTRTMIRRSWSTDHNPWSTGYGPHGPLSTDHSLLGPWSTDHGPLTIVHGHGGRPLRPRTSSAMTSSAKDLCSQDLFSQRPLQPDLFSRTSSAGPLQLDLFL